MKVLYLASEATPLVKVGGLADVAGELPRALMSLGIDVRLALPFYPSIKESGFEVNLIGEASVMHSGGGRKAEFYSTETRGVPIFLIDGDPIRLSEKIYDAPEIDVEKFIFFSLAALALCEEIGWQPEIVHANDWHTALSVAWLNAHREGNIFWDGVASVFTLHNLPYMGSDASQVMADYDLKIADVPDLPSWARTLPLPLGLATADWLSTVSPSYAMEIQTPEFGRGLEGLLHSRRERLVGILNGIDHEVWDPNHDTALTSNFSHDDIESREKNKHALQYELALWTNTDVPLLAMVTRLDHQKGVDLALDALSNMLDEQWQFILLGTGDPAFALDALLFSSPPNRRRIRFIRRFNPRLARQIYGGSDLMIIPSRYEPCGLAQMIAMRYGCIPVVRSTGGLKDTVEDYELPGQGTGFTFQRMESGALMAAIKRGLNLFEDKPAWRAMQRRVMMMDFSWQRSAEKYCDLYHRALEERRA
jgi:starch synthase